jgi:hypothetical protein
VGGDLVITQQKVASSRYAVTTTGTTEVILTGDGDKGMYMPPMSTVQFVIGGAVHSIVVGGSSPGTDTPRAFGPATMTATRDAVDDVTIVFPEAGEASESEPLGAWIADDVPANGFRVQLAANLFVRIRPNSDDADLTGINISVEDDRSADGGVRTTTAVATVERPFETLGSA